ncbi:MAG: PfkB family carbohydrate kinase [Bacillota bacterium]
MKRIVVVGDYTLDIIIKNVGAEDTLCRSAQIDIFPGGVGRNVALNLKNLGADVLFLTSYNRHSAGAILDNDSCANALNVQNITGERMNIFCAELDNYGQVNKAFYEITELEKINVKEIIAACERFRPDCLALDANLLPEQLTSLRIWCGKNNVEYALEAVSAPKAKRISAVINGCLLIKLNQYELQSYFDKTFNTLSEIEVATKQLVALGAQNVIVSLGAAGSIFANSELKHYPAEKVTVINENGSGDAMFATTLLALLQGEQLDKAAKRAVRAAGKTCMVSQSVYTGLNWEEL